MYSRVGSSDYCGNDGAKSGEDKRDEDGKTHDYEIDVGLKLGEKEKIVSEDNESGNDSMTYCA